jgi:hypothetical protein
MTYTFDTGAHNTVSNSGGLLPWDIGSDKGVKLDLGIRIVRISEHDLDFLLHGPMVDNDYDTLPGKSSRPPNEILARCDECRQAWVQGIVDLKQSVIDPETRKEKFAHPFQDDWSHAGRPGLLEAAAPKLALAGNRLFRLIFESNGDDGLKEIGRKLRAVLGTKPCNVAITSSDIFVPWGMLYTHPVPGERLAAGGANWRKEGFWGYQHLVYHNPAKVLPNATGRLDPRAPALLSVNFDKRLVDDLNLPLIEGHIRSIGELVAEPRIRRTKKTELELDFTDNRASLERILYFYCHGRGAGSDVTKPVDPHLILTDDVIRASDFEDWADGDNPLPTNPLIFINACQGGQMQTMFYQTFAVTLMKQGAVGLIGAQIDVPAVFAAEYAERVFRPFLAESKEPVRMGPLLQQVSRSMWDDHNNPLGLIYSLYRGVNCFIDWRAGASG